MKRSKGFIVGLLLTGSPLFADTEEITWRDLLPEPVQYENPFADLSTDQKSKLSMLLRYQQKASVEEDSGVSEEIEELRDGLIQDGLDADWLFEQRLIVMKAREQAASETNPDVLGQRVRMPGYVLPLEIVDQKVVEFMLVSTIGACIHTPPPPANQMVHVTYPQGFQATELFTPVWISGALHAESKTKSLQLADGRTSFAVSYTLVAETVDAYD